MGVTRRVAIVLATIAAAGLALAGMTAAMAQQDDQPQGTDPAALLERLGDLEVSLPTEVPPYEIEAEDDEDAAWATLHGDAASVRAVLDTLEPDLRRLFVDADDADGPVAAAVALVARGWLDVWNGTAALAAYEANDLAFPVTGRDDQGVNTGADEIRGAATQGLELVLKGRDRQLIGYGLLRELGEAAPDVQARLDARAAEAEEFNGSVRAQIVRVLLHPTSTVLVPTERFATSAPGVEGRANSLTVACVDRDALEELGGLATDEVVAALSLVTPERLDCPELPNDNEVRDGR